MRLTTFRGRLSKTDFARHIESTKGKRGFVALLAGGARVLRRRNPIEKPLKGEPRGPGDGNQIRDVRTGLFIGRKDDASVTRVAMIEPPPKFNTTWPKGPRRSQRVEQ